MSEDSKQFDVIVVGGGAAGMSAALWCDELGLSCLMLEKETELGGQLLWTFNPIENHLGIVANNGRELRDVFARQIENRGFVRRLQTEIVEIDLKNKIISAKNGERLKAKVIIIATGIRRRKLGVEGEDFFRGKGIIESGKKDAALVREKTVLIVGGGDAALENALILADGAQKVYVAHRRAAFRGRNEFVERISSNPKIELLIETVVTRILGERKIEKIEIQNIKNGESKILDADVLLIRIGVEPNTGFLREKLDLDAAGYIKTDSSGETSSPHVFAVGDVANPLAPTVSSAVGSGATAAKTIFAALKFISS